MSRIGNLPVSLPAGVKAAVRDGAIEIAGPLGKLEQKVHSQLSVVVDEGGQQVLPVLRQGVVLHQPLTNMVFKDQSPIAIGVNRGSALGNECGVGPDGHFGTTDPRPRKHSPKQ